MDLLLTHGYFLHEDPKELQIMKPYVPLGILYLMSHLRARNFDVEVFDSTFSSRSELLRLLETEGPAVLGVYANLMTRSSVLQILKAAKESGWKTVVGGPEPGAYVDQYLASGAEVVVIGEGEITLEELVPILKGGSIEQLAGVNGIAYLGADGQTHRTPPRAQIADIDRQPWPTREAVSIERYLETWKHHHHSSSISLITARGCPYDCRWCSHAVFGKTHRRRKPVLVVDELEWILHRYQPDMLWLADDVFTINHGWLGEFAAEMGRRGIRIPFECISRADRLNARVADLLAGLGCFPHLDRVGERVAARAGCNATRRHRRANTDGRRFVQIPGHSDGMFLMWVMKGRIFRTSKLRCVTSGKHSRTRFSRQWPTRLAELRTLKMSQIEFLLPRSWAQSSDRDIRIAGRRSRRFYANADQLLKAEVELEKLSRSGLPAGPFQLAEIHRRIEMAREGMRTTFAETDA
jgi:hypothetical protein